MLRGAQRARNQVVASELRTARCRPIEPSPLQSVVARAFPLHIANDDALSIVDLDFRRSRHVLDHLAVFYSIRSPSRRHPVSSTLLPGQYGTHPKRA